MKVIVVKDYTEMCKRASRIFARSGHAETGQRAGTCHRLHPVGMYKELVQMFDEGRIDFSPGQDGHLDEYAGLPGDNDQSYRYFTEPEPASTTSTSTRQNTNVPDGTAADLHAECERYEQWLPAWAAWTSSCWASATTATSPSTSPATSFPEKTHVVDLTQNTIEAQRPLLPVDG